LTEAATHPPTPVVSPLKALEFLNRAGTVLAGSLDFDQTLREVTQLAVPDIADWCAVYVSDEDGGEREITSRHPDPALEALLVEIRRRRRAEGASESVRVQRTLEAGRRLSSGDRQVDVSNGRVEQRFRGLAIVDGAQIDDRSESEVVDQQPDVSRGQLFERAATEENTVSRHSTVDGREGAEVAEVRRALQPHHRHVSPTPRAIAPHRRRSASSGGAPTSACARRLG